MIKTAILFLFICSSLLQSCIPAQKAFDQKELSRLSSHAERILNVAACLGSDSILYNYTSYAVDSIDDVSYRAEVKRLFPDSKI